MKNKNIRTNTIINEDDIDRYIYIGSYGEISNVEHVRNIVDDELKDYLSKMITKESIIDNIMTTTKSLLTAIEKIPLTNAHLNSSRYRFYKEGVNVKTFEDIDITVTKFTYLSERRVEKDEPNYRVSIRLTKRRK